MARDDYLAELFELQVNRISTSREDDCSWIQKMFVACVGS